LDAARDAAQLRFPALGLWRAVDNIARLVGQAGGSVVTETVYLKQIRPVLLEGAEAMNRIFGGPSAA
jgi:hypothetical protein